MKKFLSHICQIWCMRVCLEEPGPQSCAWHSAPGLLGLNALQYLSTCMRNLALYLPQLPLELNITDLMSQSSTAVQEKRYKGEYH